MTAREKLAEALRWLGSQRDVIQDTHGNLSFKHGAFVYVKPSGMALQDISVKDIVETDSTGLLTPWSENGRRPSVDMAQHVAIFQDNPTVTSICHTHSPYATAFAIAGRPMDVLCTEHADYFGHLIRCVMFRSGSAGFSHSPTLIPGERAVLLGRHGTLTFGYDDEDPMEAAKRAAALELIARKYHLAAQLNPTVFSDHLEQDDVALWYTRYNTRYGQR